MRCVFNIGIAFCSSSTYFTTSKVNWGIALIIQRTYQHTEWEFSEFMNEWINECIHKKSYESEINKWPISFHAYDCNIMNMLCSILRVGFQLIIWYSYYYILLPLYVTYIGSTI